MIWVGLSIVVLVFFVILVIRWGSARSRAADSRRIIDPLAVTDSVRVDAETLKAAPTLEGSVEALRWSRLRKANGGRTIVEGPIVFGRLMITWAPNEKARGWGMKPWQIPWNSLRAGSLRLATTTSSATLTLTLESGHTIELVGVDESRTLGALAEHQVEA